MATPPILPWLLLAAALAALLWFLKGDLGEYRRFRALTDTGSRQRRYRLWIAKAWLAFGLPALIGLALLGRLDAVVVPPPEFAAAAALMPDAGAAGGGGEVSGSLLGGAVIGAAIGGVVVGLATIWLRRRKPAANRPVMLGDVAALLPRNRVEVAHTAALSITAGVTEELGFRLFLPLLLALVTGEAVAALAIAALLFGAMHLYQGWIGVVATTAVGAGLTVLYLATGSLWQAMAVHTLIDLVALVVRPLFAGAWRPAV